MKSKKLLCILSVLVLAFAACAPAPAEVPATVAPTEPMATEPSATETQAAESPTAETATTEATTAAETPTGGVPVTGEATVNVSETADFGPILVNGEGFALYVFMNDTQDSGTSTCTDADGCTEEWPPLVTTGETTAGEGVDETLLGTITRDDSSMQVTYNGWPLYQFHEDMAAGDTNGQGVEDEFGQWFLISPDGEPIQQ